ncbi:unnamed protein product [Caenorhabditis bovis]|uniref:C-type lectin domain-containing protein n=1 Tax=Caenorhabditis bovis TaxID=2654633 RepID=A0A8S1FBA3_9PELO|nr:unnamed protein product [Caenorhabditis bovis]
MFRLLIFALVGLALVSAECQMRDKLIGGSCFKFVASKMTYNDASDYCRRSGMNLAVLRSMVQDNFLASFASSYFPDEVTEFWIGLSQPANGGPFIWSDGRYPNGNGFVAESMQDGTWITISSDNRRCFLCSYPNGYPPDLSTTYDPWDRTTSSYPPDLSTTYDPWDRTTSSYPPDLSTTYDPWDRTTTSSYPWDSTTTLPRKGEMLKVVLVALIGASFVASDCLPKDKLIGNTCFQFINAKKNFFDASEYCKNSINGGSLAILQNAIQNNFLASFAPSYFSDSESEFWIGLSRYDSSSPFRWNNFSPLTFTNFQPGYPNGNNFVAESMRNAKWITLAEDKTLQFVCSYSADSPVTDLRTQRFEKVPRLFYPYQYDTPITRRPQFSVSGLTVRHFCID